MLGNVFLSHHNQSQAAKDNGFTHVSPVVRLSASSFLLVMDCYAKELE